jgi:hypothetical protein
MRALLWDVDGTLRLGATAAETQARQIARCVISRGTPAS